MKKYSSLKTQEEWKGYLQNLLRTNDRALYRAILVIYNNQTSSEKMSHETMEHNGIGFTGTDAEFFSSLAYQILKSGKLSPNQMAIARKHMPKYWKQLMNESKRKQNAIASRVELL